MQDEVTRIQQLFSILDLDMVVGSLSPCGFLILPCPPSLLSDFQLGAAPGKHWQEVGERGYLPFCAAGEGRWLPPYQRLPSSCPVLPPQLPLQVCKVLPADPCCPTWVCPGMLLHRPHLYKCFLLKLFSVSYTVYLLPGH